MHSYQHYISKKNVENDILLESIDVTSNLNLQIDVGYSSGNSKCTFYVLEEVKFKNEYEINKNIPRVWSPKDLIKAGNETSILPTKFEWALPMELLGEIRNDCLNYEVLCMSYRY